LKSCPRARGGSGGGREAGGGGDGGRGDETRDCSLSPRLPFTPSPRLNFRAHPFLLCMYSEMVSRSSPACSSVSEPVTTRPSWKPMTVTRPSIWKLKVKLLPLSSSKTSVGDTHAALFDSRGIS